MKVVIGTDLSEAGSLAIELLAECGPAPFEAVVIVHAIDLDLYTAGGSVPQIREWAETGVESLAADLRSRGFSAVGRVEQGDVVEVLDRVAAETDADLLLVTSLGKGAVAGRFFGDTAERLVSRAGLPVLVDRVVERDHAWCRLAGSPFARPLIAVDPGGESDPSLAVAFAASLPGVERIRLVHAAAGGDSASATQSLADIAQRHREYVPVEIEVIDGRPADVVAAQAADFGATLVCVQPGPRTLGRVWTGSESHRIATRVQLPVLFVPHVIADQ